MQEAVGCRYPPSLAFWLTWFAYWSPGGATAGACEGEGLADPAEGSAVHHAAEREEETGAGRHRDARLHGHQRAQTERAPSQGPTRVFRDR